MLRRQLFDLLGHISHSRYSMRAITEGMALEMDRGHRPTLRGRDVDRSYFTLIEMLGMSIELSFIMAKMCQWPEVSDFRKPDADAIAHDLLRRVLDLMTALSPEPEEIEVLI